MPYTQPSNTAHSPHPSAGLGAAAGRFALLVAVCAAVGAAAAAAMSAASERTFSANGHYVVPPSTGQASPEALTPFDAERIARTYAVVLAEDEELLASLATTTGIDADDIADRVSAVALPNSSAVRVTYDGRTSSEVRSFFAALDDAITAPVPPTVNLRAGTLRELQAADEVIRSGGATPLAPIAGGLAGLLLGLGAASVLARGRPLVRRAEDLRGLDGPVAVDLRANDHYSVAAVAVRLLDDLPADGLLAVVTSPGDVAGRVESIAEQLRQATGTLVAERALPAERTGVYWSSAVLSDVPGAGQGARVAQDADRTLLLVAADTPLRGVASTVADLRDLGVSDVVVAVVAADRRRDRKRQSLTSPLAAAVESVQQRGDQTDLRSAT